MWQLTLTTSTPVSSSHGSQGYVRTAYSGCNISPCMMHDVTRSLITNQHFKYVIHYKDMYEFVFWWQPVVHNSYTLLRCLWWLMSSWRTQSTFPKLFMQTWHIKTTLTLNSKKNAVNQGNTNDTNSIKRTAMASRISALLILSHVCWIKNNTLILLLLSSCTFWDGHVLLNCTQEYMYIVLHMKIQHDITMVKINGYLYMDCNNVDGNVAKVQNLYTTTLRSVIYIALST